MNIKTTDATMAVFLDLENIALGARDAHYPRFDIQKVLERLLLKGHIVVKKAYCDFDRYKDFKRDLHEAAFELIEIPHVRQSGKNSADIRMVVDALDLCYTKGHVDTFVIISGDSDFSPLVSKLRENAKTVIGVGVKNSTSDLFINNCDEFIYYDDLVRAEPAKTRRASQPQRPRRQACGTEAEHTRARTLAEALRPGGGNAGCHHRGTRRGRAHLGLDDQAGHQAPQSRLQRARPWLPFLQRPAARSPEARPAQAGARREVRRLHRAGGGQSCITRDSQLMLVA